MQHLENNNILTDKQHGFRHPRSCESQLLTTVHDLALNIDKCKQTDVILLDFSKAFDKVPRQRLLSKLHFYGIQNSTLNWISSFLTNRTQQVTIDNIQSDQLPVDAGVPQGTVLGIILFLINIVGDFNCPNIDREANAIKSNSYEPKAHEELLNIMQTHPLVQMQKQPTRNENNLGLFLTNNESLVKSTSIIPGISDREIVVIDSIIRPKIAKAAKRKIYKWYSVDWIEINENLSQFKQTFLELAANRTVEENWCELKQHIIKLINDKVPHKWSSTRYNLSWFNRELTRMTKCKQRLYNKAKQTQIRAD